MSANYFGLAADAYTWALAGALGVGWAASLRLCPAWRRAGLWAVPMSLFGCVWLGFGVDFVLRFAILAYDSVTFGNATYRLANRPARVINDTLLLTVGFWMSLCIGFACGVRRRSSGPYRALTAVAPPAAMSSAPAVTVAASLCLLLAYGPIETVAALFTPLVTVGRLWTVPATLVWWEYLHTGKGSTLRWLVLLPGVLHAWFSPYREHLVLIVLVPFLAAVFAGRRFRLSTLALATAILLVVSTALIEVGRELAWSGKNMETALSDTGWNRWGEDPELSPWVKVVRRFHGLDSFLLTVDLVPSAFEHSDREVFLSSLTRGLVPRLLNPEKEGSTRALDFSQSIWVEDGAGSPAAIAPSMPGDLYEAGGPLYVLLGGLLWGLVVGLCDGWNKHTPPRIAAVVTAVFASSCAFSSERDFAHTVSTLIQTHLVMIAVALAMIGRTQIQRLRSGARAPTVVQSGRLGA
ncbi:MAG: hypothetical protein HY699_02125 [Deltaproteobacteria bacterium]|nr:hypothetical protein [Deltaproteobacteria bacterium]